LSDAGALEIPMNLELVSPTIRELFEKEEVLALVLFGSVARSEARSTSDIDLCIITKRDLPESSRLDLLSYGSRKTDISLFWDLPITIKFRVIREGRTLFSKDDLTLHKIKVDTVREYLDIAPLIRRHCMNAIRRF
jgi:predicted nucleotidyltransferase